jgi:PAS domain S-box-containing protein
MTPGRGTKAELLKVIEVLEKRLAEIEAAGPEIGRVGEPLDSTEAKRPGTGEASRESAGELEENRERYRCLAEATFEAIIIHEQGVLLETNRQFFEMFGYESEEVLGKQIIPLTVAPEAQEFLRRQIAMGNLGPYESTGLKKDGSRFPMEIRVREMGYQGRRVRVAAIRDLTAQKRVERAYRKAETRYRELVENASIGIVTDDREGDIGFFNKRYAELFGYTPREMKEQSLATLVHPDDLERVREIHRGRIAGEDVPSRYEFRGIKKDGSSVYLEVASSLHEEESEGEGGYLLGTRSYHWDITGRKRAEETLRALTAYIERAREQERKTMARKIHDELGQNFTAIRIDLSELQEELPPDLLELRDRIGSISKMIDDTAQRMKRISVELRPGLLDDLGIASAIEWQTEEFRKATRIDCTLSLDPPELVLDHQSTTTLFRVYQEVLSNIRRHAGASNIDVKLKAKAGQVRLEVADNGKGIEQEALSSPTSLGLIGMKERLMLLGGELKIKGKNGQGTRVTVVLPLTTAHEPTGKR